MKNRILSRLATALVLVPSVMASSASAEEIPGPSGASAITTESDEVSVSPVESEESSVESEGESTEVAPPEEEEGVEESPDPESLRSSPEGEEREGELSEELKKLGAEEAPEEKSSLPKEAEDEPSVKRRSRKGRRRGKGSRRKQIDYRQLPLTHHQLRADLALGPRLGWYSDDTMELFSRSGPVPTLHLRGSVGVWKKDQVSVAALVEWDRASADARSRETPTRIDWDHLRAGAEIRYHLHHRFSVHAAAAAGVVLSRIRLGERDDPARLESSPAGFTGAVSLGTNFRIFGSSDGRLRRFRGHVYVETGYGVTSALSLNPSVVDGGPLRAEPLELDSLSLSGAFLGVGFVLSF